MLSNASGFEKIYITYSYADLRQEIDGLSATIQQQLGIDPFQKNLLFMFCGQQPTRIKCLIWEGGRGFLLYKRYWIDGTNGQGRNRKSWK